MVTEELDYNYNGVVWLFLGLGNSQWTGNEVCNRGQGWLEDVGNPGLYEIKGQVKI